MTNAIARPTIVLLNLAHALDHLFLLIFATAVASIAADFGVARWEDLMPYGAGAFALFGLGSLPAGRLGDLWGRRRMMLVFFFGIGAAALLAAMTRNAWQLAAALTLIGTFAAIYHPVGIPMLLRHAERPGLTIGINGLSGNLGVALAALVTGLVIKYAGWRTAFVVPALVAFACGFAFARLAPEEGAPPARRRATQPVAVTSFVRVITILTIGSITASLIFNFTTNGNGELLRERFAGIVEDPAMLGALLAAVYVVASFAQIVVGHLIDRVPFKYLYVGIVAVQAPLFLVASMATGWWLYALMIAFMIVVFGAIPFTEAVMVRFVDDSQRSRVSGMRLTVAFGVSSLAVWILGPLVKAGGFSTLLTVMGVTALVTLAAVLFLPGPGAAGAPESATPPAAPPGSPRAAD
jgi:MFS family permease